jgi:peptide/nickel transport system substrate-binding protein
MKRLIAQLVVIVLLMGCTDITSSSERKKDPQKGGLLVMNQFQGFSTLHPPTSYESSSAQLGSHVYETLTGYDSETLELIPLLASDWEVNESSTEFTLTLREDVFFHDDPCFPEGKGRELTVDDVIYCFKVLCSNSPLNESAWLFTDKIVGAKDFYDQKQSVLDSEVEGIQKVAKNKVKISLVKPNVEFLHLLSEYSTSIYPKEAYTKYKRQISNHPVGTGPFRVKTLRLDEICILERNEEYWGVDKEGNSLPYLMGVKVGFVKDGAELIKSMRKGLLHLVMNADIVEGGNQINALLKEEQSKYSETNGNELETVYLSFLNSKGVFADVKVRKAFGLALDKQLITQEALFNSGEPGEYGLVPLGFKSYPYQHVQGPNMDFQLAQTLLAEAGFPEGNGFPVVTLQIQNRYRDVVVAQEIQKQILKNLGVSLSITAIPRQQHFERTEKGEALLWLDNWIADYRAPQSFLDLMLSNNTPEEGNSYLNTYRYRNPAYDALLKESTSIKDIKARYERYSQADRLLVIEDAAIVPIYYEKNKVISHTNVKNLSAPLFGRFDLRKVYIEEEL